ncbi:4-amino-4-deoxy-L-arabinose-phosphoundecaprenol flippase subunit ArnF [Enterobacter sp. DTU_2021_1002640_1_SI_PRY_ASU_LCPMC_013]|nr:4-amino-4-deoxy-L-arabinose-phosphoundecaprenol flippase subunit ArnF [Enterobacter sp. DTU_2021_1002640_1_SI_PRY_ASU_LCPMC_013]WNU99072.1 4-amino-4-deoxy-L-arabinose-phosphoundecaprenol flippase subunit ArnF [Enterobacter sp. DTU_2021_1002640_1_SI_PRY_ASU_LCPMC_013]
MGILFALCSVLLVSVAQLSMKYAMAGMPPLLDMRAFFHALLTGSEPGYFLFLGLLCYGLSMFLWFLALRLMELGKAYSLLSLSYAVVWLMALFIPDIHEPYSLSGLVGVCFIVTGVVLIHCIKKDSRRGNKGQAS